jgi:hypothetical protein
MTTTNYEAFGFYRPHGGGGFKQAESGLPTIVITNPITGRTKAFEVRSRKQHKDLARLAKVLRSDSYAEYPWESVKSIAGIHKVLSENFGLGVGSIKILLKW